MWCTGGTNTENNWKQPYIAQTATGNTKLRRSRDERKPKASLRSDQGTSPAVLNVLRPATKCRRVSGPWGSSVMLSPHDTQVLQQILLSHFDFYRQQKSLLNFIQLPYRTPTGTVCGADVYQRSSIAPPWPATAERGPSSAWCCCRCAVITFDQTWAPLAAVHSWYASRDGRAWQARKPCSDMWRRRALLAAQPLPSPHHHPLWFHSWRVEVGWGRPSGTCLHQVFLFCIKSSCEVEGGLGEITYTAVVGN